MYQQILFLLLVFIFVSCSEKEEGFGNTGSVKAPVAQTELKKQEELATKSIYVQIMTDGSYGTEEVVKQLLKAKLPAICGEVNILFQEKGNSSLAFHSLGLIQVAVGTESKSYGSITSPLNSIPYKMDLIISLPINLIGNNQSLYSFSAKADIPDKVSSIDISSIQSGQTSYLAKEVTSNFSTIPKIVGVNEKIVSNSKTPKETVSVKVNEESSFVKATIFHALRTKHPEYTFIYEEKNKLPLHLDCSVKFEKVNYARNVGSSKYKQMIPVFSNLYVGVKLESAKTDLEGKVPFSANYKAPSKVSKDQLRVQWISSTISLLNAVSEKIVSQKGSLFKKSNKLVVSSSTNNAVEKVYTPESNKTAFDQFNKDNPNVNFLYREPYRKKSYRLTFNVKEVSNISALANLNLKSLVIYNSGVVDLSPLKGKHLTSMNISNTNIVDIDALKGMPLEFFYANKTKFTDFSPLKESPLEFVELKESKIKSLETFQGMKTLSELYLSNTEINNLTPLSGLKLRVLEVDDTAISDLSPLEGMLVEELNFLNTKVTDLGPLLGNKNLVFLNISNTAISDLSALKESPISKLDASNTNISNIDGLKSSYLRTLNLNNTKVSDISIIKENDLGWLHLKNTEVSDISVLKGKINLEIVDLSGSKVSDISPLSAVEFIKELNLEGTQVKDLTSIKNASIKSLNLNDLEIDGLDLSKIDRLIKLSLRNTKVKSLEFLSENKDLKYLDISHTSVISLKEMKQKSLEYINLKGTGIKKLENIYTPKFINIEDTLISDISMFKYGAIKEIYLKGSKVTDIGVLKNKKTLELITLPEGAIDIEFLKGIKSLKKINNMDVVDFWAKHKRN